MSNLDQSRFFDSIRFKTSTLKRPTSDLSDPSDISLIIGHNRVKKPLKLKTPLIIPPHLTRGIGKESYLGISLGSCLAGCNINLHEPLSKEAEELARAYSAPLILDLTNSRGSIDHTILSSAELVWIEIGGAENKVFDQNGNSIVSIPPEIDEPKDLIHLVSLFKEMLGVPVVISMRGRDVDSDIDHVLVTSADAVHISCGYDFEGEEGPASKGLTSEPVTSVIEAMKHLEVFRSKEKGVKLLLSGPLRNSTDVIKLKALGVDGFGIDMVIDNILSRELPRTMKEPDWALIGEIVEGKLKEVLQGIRGDLAILGLKGFDQLERNMLVVDNYHTAAVTGLPLSGYGMEIPFWKH